MTLREIQAPLKERYRETPEAAVVTLSANHNHPCAIHGAMHAAPPSSPTIHTSDPVGLNNFPTG